MKRVNILTCSPTPVFLRQTDNSRFARDYEFYENSDADIPWDCVVVYEGIPVPKTLRCREGGLFFFSGEPSQSRFYGASFLAQFDLVVATHARIKNKNFVNANTALNWHFGVKTATGEVAYDFDALKNMSIPRKTKNFSIITSTLNMMPGHLRRLRFIEELMNRYGDKIDRFGKGVRYVEDKAQAILPYRFHICLENTAEKNYWTEKFADALLGYSVPLYYGDSSISDYFDSEGFFLIDIGNPRGVFDLIDEILKNPEQKYAEKLPALIRNREKLLDEYNFFPRLVGYLQERNLGREITRTIMPVGAFFDSRMGMWRLRVRRGFYKLGNKFFSQW